MAIKNIFHHAMLSLMAGLYLTLSQSPLADSTQKQLQHARQEIHVLQKEISQQEKARQAAKRSIEASEQALKKTRVLVNALLAKQHTSQKKLSNLYQNLYAIQKQIDQISTAIARILQKQYTQHQQFTATKLMSAQEASQQTRIQSYYRYIAKAQQKLILQLRAQQAQLTNLSGKVKSELQSLDKATTSKKIKKNKLETKKIQHHLQEKKLTKNIQRKKQYLAKLLESEKQLSALVAKLQHLMNVQTKATTSQKTRAQKVVQIKVVADANASGKKFLALKGKMKLPMTGSVTGRFGGARSAEGGTWKGIFISNAHTKQSIHAVADGTIAHAGYIVGLGQVSIVEHGKQYLTVYAGLSSVSLSQGQKVKTGGVLGQSGALDSGETGLYFEIRYMGKPINPLNWTVH